MCKAWGCFSTSCNEGKISFLHHIRTCVKIRDGIIFEAFRMTTKKLYHVTVRKDLSKKSSTPSLRGIASGRISNDQRVYAGEWNRLFYRLWRLGCALLLCKNGVPRTKIMNKKLRNYETTKTNVQNSPAPI